MFVIDLFHMRVFIYFSLFLCMPYHIVFVSFQVGSSVQSSLPCCST